MQLVFVSMDEPRVLAWKHHIGGQLAFFLSRGPKSFLSGAAHQLFVDSRINMVISIAICRCIRRKVPNILHFPGNASHWHTNQIAI